MHREKPCLINDTYRLVVEILVNSTKLNNFRMDFGNNTESYLSEIRVNKCQFSRIARISANVWILGYFLSIMRGRITDSEMIGLSVPDTCSSS